MVSCLCLVQVLESVWGVKRDSGVWGGAYGVANVVLERVIWEGIVEWSVNGRSVGVNVHSQGS